jgi:hypothetical protein
MKARITCDESHPLGQRFSTLFDLTYYSRRNGFDLHGDITNFLVDTENYDYTINFTRAMQFGQVKLLANLDKHCYHNKIQHKVINIGSYVNTLLLNNPYSSYDVEKASLKFAHRKIAFSRMFHNNYLDSYMINLGHLQEVSVDIHKHYEHLNTLALDDVIKNVKFMIDKPYIKELSVQYKQPGNHRINDGIGTILPGLY